MSINGKRLNITLEDVLPIAENMAITNHGKIIKEVQDVIPEWEKIANNFQIPRKVILSISKDFVTLIA